MRNKNYFYIWVLSVIGLVLISVNFFFVYSGFSGSISLRYVMLAYNATIIILIVLLVIIIRHLLTSEKHQRLLSLQETYIGYLQELVRAIRTQRHDFASHLQAVYGMLITGLTDEAQKYIEEQNREVRVTGEMLRVCIPELSALLMAKAGIAEARGIFLELEIATNLAKLALRPAEINSLTGNLLDNAFEAAALQEDEDKTVLLRLFESSSYYVLQVWNPGYIPGELQAKIFLPGYSTKPEGGLGLASVKSLAEKYNGRVVVYSHIEKGVKFTVLIPK